MHTTHSFSDQDLASLLEGLRLVAFRRLADADEAEDAAQETLRRVLAVLHAAGIPEGYTLQSYAHGVLRHITTDLLRSRQRFAGLPSVDLPTPHVSALERLISRERVQVVRKALRKLDRRDRALLYRCYVLGEKMADIARRTDEPAERLRKRKSRALEKLRALLGHISMKPYD